MPGILRTDGMMQGGSGPPPDPPDSFELIAAVTPITDATNSVASLASNTLSWAAGDLLLAVGSGSHGSARNFNLPTANWSPSGETWVSRFASTAVIGSGANTGGIATATAQSSETAETVSINFSSTMFALLSAFLRCKGATIVRQIASVKGETEGVGSLTATFDEDILPTSQIVSYCMQRIDTDFGPPADFTTVFNSTSGNSQHRALLAARIGHDSNSVTTTGLSVNAAKQSFIIELARPGQELAP